jgi:SSS family solute:Na+ symporter
VLLFFGKSGFKKTNNSRDFFVAGNSLGLFASVFTFSATWFSAVSMQGVTGSMYTIGYNTVLCSIVPWFLGATMLVLLASRLKKYDILTVPEFFYLRYNSKGLQAITGVFIVITYTFYIIIQIRGFGIVISELLDINYIVAISLVYLFVIYTTFGGLFSVAKTDGLNVVLTAIGIILAAVIMLSNIGGINIMHEKAAQINTIPFPYFHNITEKGGLLDPFAKGQMPPLITLTSFFGWGLGLAANPQYAIRISSAKDTKTAIKMVSYSVILLAFMYIGLMIVGIGGRVLEPTIQTIRYEDEVFPYIINNVIYSPFSSVILISITAAAISTANSQLLVAASGFTYDLYKNLINPTIQEEKFLNLNRIIIFIIGTVSLVLAIYPPSSLLIYGGYIWGFFSATFLIPLYGGVFWKKATKEGAISSFIVGLITMVVFMTRNLYSTIHPAFPSVVASSLTFYIVSNYYYKKVR